MKKNIDFCFMKHYYININFMKQKRRGATMKNIQFLQLDFNLITVTRITSNEFRIYAYLLSLYNDNKKCSYPSLETIANKLNISLTTVKKSIKRLA